MQMKNLAGVPPPPHSVKSLASSLAATPPYTTAAGNSASPPVPQTGLIRVKHESQMIKSEILKTEVGALKMEAHTQPAPSALQVKMEAKPEVAKLEVGSVEAAGGLLEAPTDLSMRTMKQVKN